MNSFLVSFFFLLAVNLIFAASSALFDSSLAHGRSRFQAGSRGKNSPGKKLCFGPTSELQKPIPSELSHSLIRRQFSSSPASQRYEWKNFPTLKMEKPFRCSKRDGSKIGFVSSCCCFALFFSHLFFASSSFLAKTRWTEKKKTFGVCAQPWWETKVSKDLFRPL